MCIHTTSNSNTIVLYAWVYVCTVLVGNTIAMVMNKRGYMHSYPYWVTLYPNQAPILLITPTSSTISQIAIGTPNSSSMAIRAG